VLALAFPKYNLWWLAWVALVPFFYALNKAPDRRGALACGLSFGLVFFGLNLFWITSLFRFGGWWVVFGWLGLALFQSFFILLFALIPRSPIPRAISLAFSWVAVEWLRGLGPFGVTAGVVGYSQADFLPFIQIASLVTVYGVSFVVVLFNAALADVGTAFMAVREKRTGINPVPTMLFVFLLVAVCLAYGYSTISHSSLVIRNFPKLALIQPNVDQMDKMNPALVMKIFDLQENMTRQAATLEPEIIIWPETAVFTYILQDGRTLPRLQALARETQAWLVIGTPFFENGRAYNSLVSFSPLGEVVSRYDKEHPVPFGEYLPFRPLLYPLLRGTGYFDNDFWPGKEVRLIEAAGRKFAAAICFESTFPGLIKERVRRGGDIILTVTNDGWFGDSDAAYQHLQNGILRAVENRRYFVQVGNTGFSAVIDPYGRVVRRARLNSRETLFFSLPIK